MTKSPGCRINQIGGGKRLTDAERAQRELEAVLEKARKKAEREAKKGQTVERRAAEKSAALAVRQQTELKEDIFPDEFAAGEIVLPVTKPKKPRKKTPVTVKGKRHLQTPSGKPYTVKTTVRAGVFPDKEVEVPEAFKLEAYPQVGLGKRKSPKSKRKSPKSKRKSPKSKRKSPKSKRKSPKSKGKPSKRKSARRSLTRKSPSRSRWNW